MSVLSIEDHKLQPTVEAKFEQIMRQYGTRILRLVYFFVKDQTMAEDITQDVFVKAYRHLPQFRGESSVHTWLYKIAVNECKGYLRSWSFRRIFAKANIEKLSETSVETEAIDNFERENIASLVMTLPQHYRQVIVLFYYEDLPISEVANILGVSEGTVRTRLHRARQQMKNLLTEEGREWTLKTR